MASQDRKEPGRGSAGVIFARCGENQHHNSHHHGDLPWCVVLCVVWHRPGESRRRDCAIAVSAMMLVNDSVCCGINIGRQFPLTADFRAIVVVFVGVCSRVGKWVGKGVVCRRKKADFFNCRAKGP